VNKDIMVADIRVIFDNTKGVFVVGCHTCEQEVEAPLNATATIINMIPEFSVKHLQRCGKEIQ